MSTHPPQSAPTNRTLLPTDPVWEFFTAESDADRRHIFHITGFDATNRSALQESIADVPSGDTVIATTAGTKQHLKTRVPPFRTKSIASKIQSLVEESGAEVLTTYVVWLNSTGIRVAIDVTSVSASRWTLHAGWIGGTGLSFRQRVRRMGFGLLWAVATGHTIVVVAVKR